MVGKWLNENDQKSELTDDYATGLKQEMEEAVLLQDLQ